MNARQVIANTLLIGSITLASACATSRALAPLQKGQSGVTLSFGGPFVQYGSAPIPVPISSVGYRYGIDGKTDLHTAFYPTAAAALGVVAFDMGFARELLDADRAIPRIMLDINTTWMAGDNRKGDPKGGFRFFPEASLILTWELGKAKHMIYLGGDVFIQPFPSFHAIFSPIFGTELMASKVVGVQLELGWVQPSKNTLFAVPVWYGPGNQGAISFKLGLDIRIPQGKKAHKAKQTSASLAEDLPSSPGDTVIPSAKPEPSSRPVDAPFGPVESVDDSPAEEDSP